MWSGTIFQENQSTTGQKIQYLPFKRTKETIFYSIVHSFGELSKILSPRQTDCLLDSPFATGMMIEADSLKS